MLTFLLYLFQSYIIIASMENFIIQNPWIILIIMLWVLPWKAVALWKAARLSHKWWFIALIVINTLAILDIIYIFIVARKAKKKNLE